MIFTCPRCQLTIEIGAWPLNCRCGCRYRSPEDAGTCVEVSAHLPVLPCIHSGAAVRTVLCDSCSGKVQIKVYACAIYGESTVQKKIDGLACCDGCLSKEAISKEM